MVLVIMLNAQNLRLGNASSGVYGQKQCSVAMPSQPSCSMAKLRPVPGYGSSNCLGEFCGLFSNLTNSHSVSNNQAWFLLLATKFLDLYKNSICQQLQYFSHDAHESYLLTKFMKHCSETWK